MGCLSLRYFGVVSKSWKYVHGDIVRDVSLSLSGVDPCASNVFYIFICDLLRIVKNFLNSACRFLVLRPAQVDKV